MGLLFIYKLIVRLTGRPSPPTLGIYPPQLPMQITREPVLKFKVTVAYPLAPVLLPL
jgi:hypothetical protein